MSHEYNKRKSWLQPKAISHPEGQLLNKTLGHTGLQLLEQRLLIQGHTFNLVAPADVDAVIDFYVASNRLDADPYWTRTWPSAIALAQELLSRPELVAGRRVCDLGAGLGVAGVAAALAGASEVVLLDREPLALACAGISALRSGVLIVGPDEADSGISWLSSFQELSSNLFDSTTTQSTNACTTPIKLQTFDWLTSEVPRQFDVVLACDVLYETAAVAPIGRVLSKLLRPDNGSLLLCDPPIRNAQNKDRLLTVLGDLMGISVVETCTRSCCAKLLNSEMKGAVDDAVAVSIMHLRTWMPEDISSEDVHHCSKWVQSC